MKNVILMLALVFSASLWAKDAETFTFNGAENLKEILLQKDVYRTEYRTEQQQTTCTRQVLDGYRRECHYETRQNCYYVPRTCQNVPRQVCQSAPPVCRPVCHQGPQGQICRQVCSGGGTTCHTEYQQQCTGGYNQCTPYQYQVCADVPVYRTETYACTQTVQVPYQVLDHQVDAKATLHFANLPVDTQANEAFTVAIVNDDVVLSVASSKKVLIYAQKLQEVVTNGGVRVIGTVFNISFINLEDVKASMTSINQVQIQNNVLTFAIGKAITNFTLTTSLKIEQKKLGRNPILINRTLTNFEVQPSVVNGQQMFTIDLAKLGVDLDDKTYTVTINADAILRNERPVNYQDLPLLKLVKEVEIKL